MIITSALFFIDYNIFMVNYSVVIQAGGQSTRMGTDKGLLQFGKHKMVEYILQQVSGLGKNNFIISNQPYGYQGFGLPVYPDIYTEVGALGGFHSVLSYLQTDYALVLACDMPFIKGELIDYMISLAIHSDIIIPRLGPDGRLEPFRGLYSKRCLPAVEKAITAGKRRVISFFEDLQVRYVEEVEIHRFDPEEQTFFNVNTPEDLEQAIRMAKLG